MLIKKKARIDRLIASIDDILKGDNKMDFEVFDKNEIEELWNATYNNANEEQKAVFIERYGSIEEWKKQFLHNASTAEAQKEFCKDCGVVWGQKKRQ